jgi:protein-S-isoprenylcysteine O-methyltransferase Ste14
MYAGEVIVLFGGAMSCFSLRNLMFFLTIFLTIYLRIRWEEKIIKGYEDYKKKVPWRLIPGIW